MPHKSKKEKDPTKPARSKKSGSKNGPVEHKEGSNKKVPPSTQVMRVKQPGSHSAMKREKRFSTSSFPLSANRELHKLSPLAVCPACVSFEMTPKGESGDTVRESNLPDPPLECTDLEKHA
ncbi:serine/threonine-protein phosphatase 2A 56 kDa regulatory subunit delta isoform-like [Channa argus]|uniref:serine/threonine-protein phosphatase 2A 56 kDa regulatory subunit delta isoform-like n=1 Tax=Channa argus TaxID=215402 RepID=UPI003522E1AC